MVDKTYEIVDQAHSTSVVWSPCGTIANLNINGAISLTATNATGTGYISTDSTDTKFVQELHVQWQQCNTTTDQQQEQQQQQQQS